MTIKDKIDFGLLSDNKEEKQKERQERQLVQSNYKLQKQSISKMMMHFTKSSFIEISRRPCMYLLAFSSIFMVVMTSCISQSIIASMPIIFKSQAESINGQIDAYVTPTNTSSLFNFTKVYQVLDTNLKESVAVRIQTNGSLTSQSACNVIDTYTSIQQFNTNSQQMNKVSQSLGTDSCRQLQTMSVRVIQSLREKTIGLGEWTLDTEINKGECVISEQLANMVNIKEGDFIYVKIELPKIINNIGTKYRLNNPYTKLDGLSMMLPLRVQHLFTDIGMKVGEGQQLTNSLFIEMSHFLEHAGQYLQNGTDSVETGYQQILMTENAEQYGSELIFNYANRDIAYIQSNYDAIQNELIAFGSKITENLGFFAVQLQLPLLETLFTLRFVSLFFGLVINMIIFILLLLSIILIYSLLLVTVETKSFDLGIIRILGLNKIGIIAMILIQCLSYVIPALISGLLVSIAVLDFISNYLKQQVNANISKYPSDSAILFSCAVGIIIPICSCIVPVKIALKQQLSEALDSDRNKTKAIQIKVESSGYSVSENRIYFSLLSTFFGVAIYYLLPLSLLSFDIGLMLTIFFMILIGMLIGAVLLTINIQYLFEKLIIYVFFICYKPAIKTIIVKNMAAHRIRNRRTGLMYSISLAFVIFLLVSYQLSIKFSLAFRMQQQGTELILSAKKQSKTIHLGEYGRFIQQSLSKEVQDFAYETQDLQEYMQKQNKYQQFSIKITHMGRLFQYIPTLQGISPNYLSIVYPEYNKISQKSCEECSLDLSQQLYTAGGSQKAIMAQVYYDKLDLANTPKQSFFIRIQSQSKQSFSFQESWYQYKMLATVTSFSGFKFSKSPSRTNQPLLMSIPTYIQLANFNDEQNINSYENIPVNKILFQLKDNSKATKSQIKNKLQAFMNERGESFQIQDITDFETSMKSQETIIDVLFSTITYIVMFLCYFSLVSAMTANIYEQSKEISVFRALGITKSQMISIYKYEAFVLVFSSSVMGLIVGTLIGFMMTMQRGLFTDLPLSFIFPTQNFLVILITSIIVSYLSTRQAANHIMKKQISEISRLTF